MILGVGVALAKAERERRAATRARLARRTSLLQGEPPAMGLRRVLLGQLDLAIELLETHPGEDRSEQRRTVHECRKALKRLRALLRLLRPAVGEKRFKHENAALRRCARRLAGARDAEVVIDTLEGLLRSHPKLADSRRTGTGVRRLRAQLLAELDAATGPNREGHSLLEEHRAIAAELRAIRARIAGWQLREDPGKASALGAPGLEHIYREGRRRLRRARRRGEQDALHAWRKRVKDLRYAAETLDRGAPARTSKSGARLHRTARRADRLGETLGEEHDLALLALLIRRHRGLFKEDKRTRKVLLKLIARRRKQLRRRALRDGERLYRRKPKSFMRRLHAAL